VKHKGNPIYLTNCSLGDHGRIVIAALLRKNIFTMILKRLNCFNTM